MKRLFTLILAILCACSVVTAVSCASKENAEEKIRDYFIVQFTDSKSSKLIIDTQNVKSGELAKEPKYETHEGCEFDGWYVKSVSGDEKFNFDTPIYKDTQVFAKYIEK